MHFLTDYFLFLVKTATIILAILALIAGLLALLAKAKEKEKTGKLSIKKINEKYDEYKNTLNEIVQSKKEKKQTKKIEKQKTQEKIKNEKDDKKRLFVLNFSGDIKASAVAALREEITSLLLILNPFDEVLLRLESPGGIVNAYGLAASQLDRLKAAKIKLTIAVDKMAASGGYLMACTADEIIAAPFAIIGSIGVIAQLPNFHRFLRKKNIDFEQVMAGRYKRTLTVLGKNTTEGRKRLQEEVEEIHRLFQNYITQHRPQVKIEQVATGEYWLAIRAIELQLIDRLQTSDDYLLNARNHCDLYEVQFLMKKSIGRMLCSGIKALTDLIIQFKN